MNGRARGWLLATILATPALVLGQGAEPDWELEQDAVVEAGNILISMVMGDEPADSFYLCGCESINF